MTLIFTHQKLLKLPHESYRSRMPEEHLEG